MCENRNGMGGVEMRPLLSTAAPGPTYAQILAANPSPLMAMAR
jgi:hypothetical protein